jgi:transcriptional regulator with XRE-family HTH domain
MKCAQIDGAKLRTYMHERGMRQLKLGEDVGVTRFQVARWCQKGSHAIKLVNIEKMASAFGVSRDALLSAIERRPHSIPTPQDLTPAEADCLEVYRRLSPLGQAKARLECEAILQDEITRGQA